MGSNKVLRGEVWEVDLEPQTHKEERGKRNRPALVIKTDALNASGHPTTIVVMGTTNVKRDKDYFSLRVALVNQPGLGQDTDPLIDQVRAVSKKRFMGTMPLTSLSTNHLKRVEAALKLLTSH